MNNADDEVYKEHISFEVRKGYVQVQYRDFDKIIGVIMCNQRAHKFIRS